MYFVCICSRVYGIDFHCVIIFCDLAKAFDCVYHEILLTKLHVYGIQGIAAKWFRSYLTRRKQKVVVKSPKNNQTFSQTG
jgi:hypothetical protein